MRVMINHKLLPNGPKLLTNYVITIVKVLNGEVGYDNNFQQVVLRIKSCGCSEFKQAPFFINCDNFLLYILSRVAEPA